MTTTAPLQGKGTILLVDDLPENLLLLSELLIKLGYTIRSVTSGRMALKTLNIKLADLILLDIKMPEMDGYQVCRAIKADEKLRDIPIIFISALDDKFDKVKAFDCGGVDYITKPFEIEEVVARLENQLTIQRQKIALQMEVKKRQETEEVLYQSRALLSSILNSTLDGIAALQSVRNPQTGEIEDFCCLVANPIIARIFNREGVELIGKLVVKKLTQRINPDFFSRIITVVETGVALEEDFFYSSGESCWYQCVAVKLGDGVAITVRNITTRKQMELELQKNNHSLQILAHLDGLTKIANRRCFDEFLVREWKRLHRSQLPLSLLMLDVDYFKLYNDSYGHQQGDDCLIQIAQALEGVVSRPADLVARYGGEEFVVVLPDTHQEGAIVIVQAIRQAIENLSIPHRASKVRNIVSVSIGISCLTPNLCFAPESIVEQADKALYQAKHQGRNQFVVFQTE